MLNGSVHGAMQFYLGKLFFFAAIMLLKFDVAIELQCKLSNQRVNGLSLLPLLYQVCKMLSIGT